MAISYSGSHSLLLQLRGEVLNRALAALHSNESLPHYYRLRLTDLGGFNGDLELHIGSPTCRLLETTSEVARIRLSIPVRARLLATAGTAIVEEIHGFAQSVVELTTTLNGDQQLFAFSYSRTNGDSRFLPDPSLGPFSTQAISAINRALRQFLQNHFHPSNALVSLSGTFLDIDEIGFDTRTGASKQFAELFFSTESDADGDTEFAIFIDNIELFNLRIDPTAENDFAVVCSERFVADLIAKKVASVLEELDGRTASGDVPLVGRVTYSLSINPNSVEVDFQPQRTHLGAGLLQHGRIRVALSGRATSTSAVAPTINFTVHDRFELAIENGVIVPVPIGEPRVRIDITNIPDWITDLLIDGNEINSNLARFRNRLVADSRPVWIRLFQTVAENRTDQGPLGRVFAGMRLPGTRITYKSLNIIEGALVVQGGLDMGGLGAPHARFSSATLFDADPSALPGLEFNARTSWVPGGTLERYRWFLGERGQFPLHEIIETGRFYSRDVPILGELPDEYFFRDPTQCISWCLEITGQQSGSQVQAVYCLGCGGSPAQPGTGLTRPPPIVPITATDSDGGATGHAALGGIRGAKSNLPRPGIPVLVHLAGNGSIGKLAAVRGTLRLLKRRSLFSVVLVVATGKYKSTVNALVKAAKRGWPLIVGEDIQRAWTKAYGLNKPGDSVLVGSSGQILSSGSAMLDPPRLKAAIKQLGKEKPSYLPLYSSSPTGPRRNEPAPDFRFELNGKNSVNLSLMRAAGITLVFWTHWSQPSIERLRAVSERAHKSQTLCIGIHCGDGSTAARAALKKHKIIAEVVFDRDLEISARYGIRFWPTTISIDGRMNVSWIATVHD